MTRRFILAGSQVDLAFRLVPNLECRVVDTSLVARLQLLRPRSGQPPTRSINCLRRLSGQQAQYAGFCSMLRRVHRVQDG